ncbi:hypothetical protein DI270_028375 [Microbispora triticiradicis]|uniref:SPOR domain-containing protein n=3 Tax=Microbispora TaxID=2005 RepID=A0ABY3M4E8_9ACTN|nr:MULTISPECIES: hypothetical protein [Microbispora]RGA01656.1 hypothetical protein DI270_028375 [Microbispora triticiradicis]TLP56974.1 hypothetical protein FED44_21335 [Microbispora fusca]TYB66929.1 hypothetical protein FXF59_03775 [Microbispora tritici]
MSEEPTIWEIRLGVYATAQQAEEIKEHVTKLLCPDPDHAPLRGGSGHGWLPGVCQVQRRADTLPGSSEPGKGSKRSMDMTAA